MAVCSQCGTTSDGAKFCPECGTPLVAAMAAGRRERRVVSVVFADLVGFTSRSERLDVEDVQAFLGGYHELLRRELESHGGVVEKFIGDAVMAVFGAPVAHEDDGERAVRSALSIQDAVAEMRESKSIDLHVRVGVTSGEALVALGVDPLSGEGMATGDVVNTAARLQSAAPVDGVLVDEWTYRVTDRAIRYEQADPVTAKGKAEPVVVWRAAETRSLRPEQAPVDDLPLVGREQEAAQLVAALERARGEPSSQLVSIIGEPGIGKTRLVEELGAHVEGLPELVTWRRGRSLSYGEGIAFWALGEMVKAQAGILESDSAEIAAEKLGEAAAGAVLDERDREWILRHLRPLVGLDSSGAASAESGRVEAFAAWRRFFEALAEAGPTILVFEDIHWADDALLDFIDLLADRAGAVPLLLVCTARPELFERRDHWGGGKANATTISLRPLSGEDTARLVGQLLDQALLPAEVQQALLERADGNPLYAQEYIRMLQDRGALIHAEAGWTLTDSIEELPESIQGIIAARLDTLTPDERSLIQDASVIGKTAWIGATCTLTERSYWEAEELLHSLERKQLLQRVRRSSIDGETEFNFSHALTRDVAYSQIRRADRAHKHEAAAEWIEALAGERDDKAELLADHYHHALALRAALNDDTASITPKARAAFAEAARQAAVVYAHHAAARHYHAALKLTPQADPERPALVLGEAGALSRAGAADDQLLQAAADVQVNAEDWEAAAEAELLLARWCQYAGKGDEQDAHLAQGAEYASRVPPGEVMCMIANFQALKLLVSGRPQEAHALTEQLLPIAERAGLSTESTTLLQWRGLARVELGDPDGTSDVRAAAEALALRADKRTPVTYGNLAEAVRSLGDMPAADAAYATAAGWAPRFADPHQIDFIACEQAYQAYHAARWETADRLLEAIDTTNRDIERDIETGIRITHGRTSLARGQDETAITAGTAIVGHGVDAGDDELVYYGLALEALCHAAHDDASRGLIAGQSFLTRWHETGGMTSRAIELCEIAPTLATAQLHTQIRDAALLLTPASRWRAALLLIADQHYAEAAALYEEIGSQPLAADAHLLAANQATQNGRTANAQKHANAVLAFAEKTGSTLYQERAEGFLKASA
jgi:class 3 adenylate cyclase